MRAMMMYELGGPLKLADVPVPEIGPGEALAKAQELVERQTTKVAELRAKRDEADDAARKTQEKLAQAEAAYKKDATAENKTALETAQSNHREAEKAQKKAQKNLDDAEKDLAAFEQMRKDARTPDIKLASSHEMVRLTDQRSESMEKVANATAYIVALTQEKSYVADFCYQLLELDTENAGTLVSLAERLAKDDSATSRLNDAIASCSLLITNIANQQANPNIDPLSVELGRLIWAETDAVPPKKAKVPVVQ